MIQDMVVVFFESLRYAHYLGFNLQSVICSTLGWTEVAPVVIPLPRPTTKLFEGSYSAASQMTKGKQVLLPLQMGRSFNPTVGK